MFKRLLTAFAVLFCLAASFGAPGTATAATCTPTGFMRDSINLTARMINPVGTVSGGVDATGCNIAVYYGPGATGKVDNAQVRGANYFGIVNNGGNVVVNENFVFQIGERPLNGSQHGNAIYCASDAGVPSTGKITNNIVSLFQKNGITLSGPQCDMKIMGNWVLGQGPVDYIAQNGIEVGLGAQGKVQENHVFAIEYTGANDASSTGILIYGGLCFGGAYTTGINVSKNEVGDNDIGIFMGNYDASCNAPTTPTNNVADSNDLGDAGTTNISGDGSAGYQAGIADTGDQDQVTNNTICGPGYALQTDPPSIANTFPIDATFTNNLVASGNICGKRQISPTGPTVLAANTKHRHVGWNTISPAF